MNLKIGDRVVLARVTKEMFWSALNPRWLDKGDLKDYIGKFVTIERYMDGSYRVRTDDGLYFCFVRPDDLDVFMTCCHEALADGVTSEEGETLSE